MPNFEVRVRLLDVTEADAWSARQEVETRLRASGFRRWQIVSLRVQENALPRIGVVPPRRVMRKRRGEAGLGTGLLLAAVLAWTLLFWWELF